MPYKDPEKARIAALGRKRHYVARKHEERYGPNVGDMRGRHGHAPRGSAHPRWNRIKILTKQGYVKIRVGRKHPLADGNGYACEHWVIWVSAGNALPRIGDLLHHKDHDRQNNRLENLELHINQTHAAAHGRLRLSDEEVRMLRENYAAGCSMGALANSFDVAIQTVSKIVRGITRKSAPGPISPGDNRRRGVDGKFGLRKSAGRLLDGREHSEVPW